MTTPGRSAELPAPLRVPVGRAEGVHRAGGSRFLALAAPAGSVETALAVRQECRRRYRDATHHAYAARFLDQVRLHDDGEPVGTGGRPILRAIERVGLHGVVVVVSRYFGGTKLGTGRLARAYGAAADESLRGVVVREAVPGARITLAYRYEDTGAVMRVLEGARTRRLEPLHGERAMLRFLVPSTDWDRLLDRLRDATAGRIELLEQVDEGEFILGDSAPT